MNESIQIEEVKQALQEMRKQLEDVTAALLSGASNGEVPDIIPKGFYVFCDGYGDLLFTVMGFAAGEGGWYSVMPVDKNLRDIQDASQVPSRNVHAISPQPNFDSLGRRV